MNINTNSSSPFPSQVVPDEEKMSLEYGMQVSRAIEQEWFGYGGSTSNRYALNYKTFNTLRLYARGEQPMEKYKNELAINGDLSYMNIDWTPVPVLSKFSNIVCNGISQKEYDLNAYAQDPESIAKRTKQQNDILFDMTMQAQIQESKEVFGTDASKSGMAPGSLPQTTQDLDLFMQLKPKMAIEVAEEEAINTVFAKNKFDLTKERVDQDLVNIGIGMTKTTFNKSEGLVINYVDPANCVWSYTEDPHFKDLYYFGEVKQITLSELAKEFPNVSDSDLEKIQKSPINQSMITGFANYDRDQIQVLYFEYKTYMHQVFKIKRTDSGLEKAIEKTDAFNPPENDNFERVSRTIEVLYQGAKVIGTDMMLKWEMSENMSRPYADTTKVVMSYAAAAPRMYKGKIQSLIGKCIGFADIINLTNLKLQQVLSRMVPDGVYLDVDGLAEVDLGNGTTYNPAEALNMYFQTGSVVGRSLTQEGDMNRGKIPIQELQTGSGSSKIQSLIAAYNYNLQMIRDVTGLNEARDGAMPDSNALVGLQKMAANASNTATNHILKSSLYLTLRTAEIVSLKLTDVLNNPLTENALKNSISIYNVETLKEMSNLNMHDFGIFLELEPDDEMKAELTGNINMALQQGGIDIEDAIDIRNIKNIQLANEMLKLKRRKKEEQAQARAEQLAGAQAQAQAQAAEQMAMQEVQKQQALTAEKVAIEEAKSNFEIQRMQMEAEMKQMLMAKEFEYNMQLAQGKNQGKEQMQNVAEDRKDNRTKLQATQQSEMIQQRQQDGMPTDFESSGNDSMGGFDLSTFEPQ
tara:strand:- start:6762 stop:9173 length:2412 start_codon:yes stop_codon:yes gene_type:complete